MNLESIDLFTKFVLVLNFIINVFYETYKKNYKSY